jgi:transposase-like protein
MRIVKDKHTPSKRAGSSPGALPPITTTRWVARRKAAVVAAVENGLLTMIEACRRYGLSPEEFAEWERHYKAEGVSGLRAQLRLVHPDRSTH